LTVRSPALAVLGLLLMASAAGLGAVLVHDGEVAPGRDLAAAAPGQDVSVKGTPAHFEPTGSRAWRTILPALGNHTYTMDDPENGVVALLTGDEPAPEGVVLAEGTVALAAPHPDGSGRLLVVIAVHDWVEPLLFD
jgi:hypothetical protein